MVTIKRAADLTGLTPKAIRHYEHLGLCPCSPRSAGGYRLYSPQALDRLRQIRYYRELGFSLEEIRGLLDAPENAVREALTRRRQTVTDEIARQQRALATLDAALSIAPRGAVEGGVAVVTIDLQNDILEGGALACKRIHRILPPLAKLFARARERGVPVIYICDWHEPDDPELLLWNDHMLAGTRGAEIIDQVAPGPQDIVIHKNRFNGFVNTDLQAVLDALHVRTVVMTGWRTDVCVAQTAIEAFYRGYRVVLAEDGVGSTSQAEHASGLSMMRINYGFDCWPCETVLEKLLDEQEAAPQ